MKFGQEFQRVLESDNFPPEWRDYAIEYKHLKKCIKKVHCELEEIGLKPETVASWNEWIESPQDHSRRRDAWYSASKPSLSTVAEEFVPQLRVLVDSETGVPLDATLEPKTRASLQKLAKNEMLFTRRRSSIGIYMQTIRRAPVRQNSASSGASSLTEDAARGARWIQIPLASAKDFFDLLAPKVIALERLRETETEKLEEEILTLGDNVENVVEPVREGYEATRSVSYRDLYFWREMFRLYLEQPIFYSPGGKRGCAVTFREAKRRLEEYDRKLRDTGVLQKMKTPLAQQTAKRFLDLNVEILRIMHFQEMNAQAMTKILKKFDKRTRLDGEGALFLRGISTKYPIILPRSAVTRERNTQLAVGGFADSIARDLNTELATKILCIIPQLNDWTCPVCYAIAWLPVRVGCCGSVVCLQCVIRHKESATKQCPVCQRILQADTRNLDFETMDFLEKFFPIEVRRRREENEQAALERQQSINDANDFKRKCTVM